MPKDSAHRLDQFDIRHTAALESSITIKEKRLYNYYLFDIVAIHITTRHSSIETSEPVRIPILRRHEVI